MVKVSWIRIICTSYCNDKSQMTLNFVRALGMSPLSFPVILLPQLVSSCRNYSDSCKDMSRNSNSLEVPLELFPYVTAALEFLNIGFPADPQSPTPASLAGQVQLALYRYPSQHTARKLSRQTHDSHRLCCLRDHRKMLPDIQGIHLLFI